MDIRTRVGKLTDNERLKLIVNEVKNLRKEIEAKSVKTHRTSKVLSIINILLSLSIIFSAAAVTILSAIFFQDVAVSVLGGFIFALSGINQLLKLGDKGVYYRQGTFRLKKIGQQTVNMLYMFHNFTAEEILTHISNWRTQIDEIEFDLFSRSVIGEVKFEQGVTVEPRISEPRVSLGQVNPDVLPKQIHIHFDSPNNSPNISPKNSPVINRKNDSELEVVIE